MQTIKGPSIHLAQFSDHVFPFNNLASISAWVADNGFKAVQLPAWDKRLFDVNLAAQSQNYCDEITGILDHNGLQISELSTHIFGQLMAVHPAYDALCDGFAPDHLHGKPKERMQWAEQQMLASVQASARLGLHEMGTFSGSLAWPYIFPFPQRPEGLIETAFDELARRWMPILNACDEYDVNLCYEIHPAEDLHDGASFEMFLERTKYHPRCNILFDPSHFILQQLNYLEYLDIYKDFIRMFHVKDAEFTPTGRQGMYGGYQNWGDRAGRFRSTGDGQVDFKSVFSKLAYNDYQGWATLEWECCLKNKDDGAREGAEFIKKNIIHVTDKIFDDFAAAPVNQTQINQLLGI
ncbi:sugar phosphate isomerase/epimerase [Acinetobacter sp. C26M]|uniref:sugar phosphate isomerase/epimerase family protein n=1 Tax=unclassified Acinetobacter TaxID=196816 RepID=UPI002036C7AA|nr:MULTISPECIES: sugar phosphate isomerase/epimerase family protein [unclassified Acinetobacter]USA44887.1 sugar phosphate isomerase/epimerase [Acinetobacter sp. C26M]USA48390.1 sugar phosphate isomerase/epimerase [Acinetobacter sp. C26G]